MARINSNPIPISIDEIQNFITPISERNVLERASAEANRVNPPNAQPSSLGIQGNQVVPIIDNQAITAQQGPPTFAQTIGLPTDLPPGQLNLNNFSTGPTGSDSFLQNLIQSTQLQQLASDRAINKTLSNKESGQGLALLPLIFAANANRSQRQQAINSLRADMANQSKVLRAAKAEQKFLSARPGLIKTIQKRLDSAIGKNAFDFLASKNIDLNQFAKRVSAGESVGEVVKSIRNKHFADMAQLESFKEFSDVRSPKKINNIDKDFNEAVTRKTNDLLKESQFNDIELSTEEAIDQAVIFTRTLFGRLGKPVPDRFGIPSTNISAEPVGSLSAPTAPSSSQSTSPVSQPENPFAVLTGDINKETKRQQDRIDRNKKLTEKSKNPRTRLSVAETGELVVGNIVLSDSLKESSGVAGEIIDNILGLGKKFISFKKNLKAGTIGNPGRLLLSDERVFDGLKILSPEKLQVNLNALNKIDKTRLTTKQKTRISKLIRFSESELKSRTSTPASNPTPPAGKIQEQTFREGDIVFKDGEPSVVRNGVVVPASPEDIDRLLANTK